MSTPVVQGDTEQAAVQGFGPSRDDDYDVERQAGNHHVQPNATEDPAQRRRKDHEADSRSPKIQPKQGTKGTTKSPSGYFRFLYQRWPFTLILKQPRGKVRVHRKKQCCFLCLHEKGKRPYAILVPCFRPSPGPQIVEYKIDKAEDGTEIWIEKIATRRGSELHPDFESDSVVYERLREACFQHQPRFKRWIPYHGIVDVREVKFRSLGPADESNRRRIHIYPLDVDKIREEAENTIKISEHTDYEEAYGCCNNYHGNACEGSEGRCMAEQIEAARQQQFRLDTCYLLKDCIRDPKIADQYMTLRGMAQESPIIHLKNLEIKDNARVFDREKQLPGLEVCMGWQIDRIESELPFVVSCILWVMFVIWASVIAGGLAGEWSVSTAFGQMALASLAVMAMGGGRRARDANDGGKRS